jgi:hypothetical protein
LEGPIDGGANSRTNISADGPRVAASMACSNIHASVVVLQGKVVVVLVVECVYVVGASLPGCPCLLFPASLGT